MVKVVDIVKAVPGAVLEGAPDVVIRGVTHDSRRVEKGFLFAVIRGQQTDGRYYVDSALKKGAAALLVDEVLPSEMPQIVVGDVRRALGPVAAAYYGGPTERLSLVGITGTNGKTTTAYLVEAALAACGHRPGVMSTVEYRFGSERLGAEHTTPEATVVQSVAARMVEAGVSHMILEASSHGLDLGRLGGCRFRTVAFTNLTQDHLDYHRDMDGYGASKMKLFTSAIADNPDARVVVNADDPFAEKIIGQLKHPVVSVSVDPEGRADIRPARKPGYSIDGIRVDLVTPKGPCTLASPLIGAHNLSNLLVGLGICLQLDCEPAAACLGLGGLQAVPGRLERISGSGETAVFVDYAHTPDALFRVLGALRPLTRGRLIAVFGCGGDRDPGKRPLMGEAVRDGADLAVVTSDNPRSEDPEAIIQMIVPGLESDQMPRVPVDALGKTGRGWASQLDRRSAIRGAIGAARPGDTVLIAGKGHEDYQILNTGRIDFDDRKEAALALRCLEGDRG